MYRDKVYRYIIYIDIEMRYLYRVKLYIDIKNKEIYL